MSLGKYIFKSTHAREYASSAALPKPPLILDKKADSCTTHTMGVTDTPPQGSPVISKPSTGSVRRLRTNSNQNRPTVDTQQDTSFHTQYQDQPQPGQQFPSVTPVVDDHDRAWAEMDVLDDAIEMAHQIKANKSFFGTEHGQAMEQLRSKQTELAQLMSQTNLKHDKSQYTNLWQNNDIGSLRRDLFDEEHFETIENHVSNTLAKLDDVSKCMEQVDEHSKDFWQAT